LSKKEGFYTSFQVTGGLWFNDRIIQEMPRTIPRGRLAPSLKSCTAGFFNARPYFTAGLHQVLREIGCTDRKNELRIILLNKHFF
jgi:hypothetical protein